MVIPDTVNKRAIISINKVVFCQGALNYDSRPVDDIISVVVDDAAPGLIMIGQ